MGSVVSCFLNENKLPFFLNQLNFFKFSHQYFCVTVLALRTDITNVINDGDSFDGTPTKL